MSGGTIKTLIISIAICLTLWGFLMTLSDQKNSFSHEKLYEEMRASNEIEHPFSIVAIKDTFEKYPNKFLLYFDSRWKCWFFFNFKTNNDLQQNENNIKSGLSSKLKVDADDIDLEYKDEAIHHKYSESDNVEKYYHHILYNCILKNFNDEIRKDKFTIDGVDYAWMTIDEMEKNPSINKRNLDVVEFVKRNN